MAITKTRLATHNGDAITDLVINASLGQIPGAESVYVFGRNQSIQNGTSGLLWELGGTYQSSGIQQASAVDCYISSTSIADVGIILRISVIDENWDRRLIGVSLNGNTAVVLPIQVRRVLSIENMSSTAFVGNVYAGTSASPTLGVQTLANTMGYAKASAQLSNTAVFTVPLGKVLLVYKFGGGTPTNDSVIISGHYSNPESNVFKTGSLLPVYRTYREQAISFYPVQEKCDIYITATAYTSNVEAMGDLLGVLVDKEYFD